MGPEEIASPLDSYMQMWLSPHNHRKSPPGSMLAWRLFRQQMAWAGHYRSPVALHTPMRMETRSMSRRKEFSTHS